MRGLTLAAVLATTLTSSTAPESRFHYERPGTVTWPEELVVEIDGATCADAVVRIAVRRPEREIYRFEMPYATQPGVTCDPERAPDAAREFLLRNDLLIATRETLPRPLAREEMAERGLELLVPPSTYSRIRAQTSAWGEIGIYEHPSGPGETRWAVFDEQEQKAVAVLRKSESLAESAAARREAKRIEGEGFRDSARIAFSSSEPTDLLEVWVTRAPGKGEPYEPAWHSTLHLRISDARGRQLFFFESEDESTTLFDSAEEAVETTLDRAGMMRSRSLGPFSDSHLYAAEVLEPDYERLSAANLPMVHIPLHHAWYAVIYDAKAGKGVIIAFSAPC